MGKEGVEGSTGESEPLADDSRTAEGYKKGGEKQKTKKRSRRRETEEEKEREMPREPKNE